MEFVAAFVAWLGVSIVLLAEGRRGLALGTAVAALGLAGVCLSSAGPVAAAVVIAGGALASVRRWLAGPPGWGIMPAGSTPRLVTCVAAGLLALWLAVAVTSGGGGALRFAVMASIGLAGARVLWSEEPSVLLTAVAVLALALATGAQLGPDSPGVWPFAAAAIVAAGSAWIPLRALRAA
jgi:hypothetical protein